MAAILDLGLQQLELARVGDVLGAVRGSLPGDTVGQLRTAAAGVGTRLSGLVCRLAGDVDGGAGRGVPTSVGNERLGFLVGHAVLRVDTELHPHGRGLAVGGNLLIEELPRSRSGIRPGL